MNDNLFSTLRQAHEITKGWRQNHNQTRPHSALNWLTPGEFTAIKGNKLDKAAQLCNRLKDNLKMLSKQCERRFLLTKTPAIPYHVKN